jgi:hypothetical protein
MERRQLPSAHLMGEIRGDTHGGPRALRSRSLAIEINLYGVPPSTSEVLPYRMSSVAKNTDLGCGSRVVIQRSHVASGARRVARRLASQRRTETGQAAGAGGIGGNDPSGPVPRGDDAAVLA